MTILVVDVSSANAMGRGAGRIGVQDDLDWKWLAAQGVRGAYVEGYIGNDGPNAGYAQQRADAAAAGLATGVYDFCFPLEASAGHPNRDPIAQARLHAAHDGLWQPGDLRTMADLEWPYPVDVAKWRVTRATTSAWASLYLPERSQLAGCRVGVYSYPDWAHELLELDHELVDGRDFWGASSTGPWAPSPWSSATLWQKTGQELLVPTTSGRPPVKTDVSEFLGDEDDWAAFRGL